MTPQVRGRWLAIDHHQRKFTRILDKKVGDLELADNISFYENETKNAHQQFNTLSGVVKKFGLLINIDKTIVPAKNINPMPEIILGGTVLQVVEVSNI